MERLKILVVGDPRSIHTSKFVSLLQENGNLVSVFQSEYRYGQDEHLENVTIYVMFPYVFPINNNSIIGHYSYLNIIIKCFSENEYIKKMFSLGHYVFLNRILKLRAGHLCKVLKNNKPDIVFSLKMQNDGYTVSMAKEKLGKGFKPKWIHFNWGTDIEFFGKVDGYVEEHLPKIKKLLSHCDYHIADCERDARQAFDFGFKGISLGSALATGGFDIDELRRIKSKYSGNEKIILIKGRQGGYVGKAFNIFIALHRLSELLEGYQIKIMNSTPEVQAVISYLKQFDKLNYEIVHWLPYHELLEIFARSRLAISASDVDGTPSFLIEAMAMGAFPIHSDMESIREWIEDGKNGFLFPVDDIEKLTECIREAILKDALIERAREINWEIAVERMDRKTNGIHMQKLIEKVYNAY